MASGIVALVEHDAGSLKKVSREVCSEAVRQGAARNLPVHAVAVGPGSSEALAALGDCGITQAVAVEGAALGAYSAEWAAACLADAIRALDPAVVLTGATSRGRDLLGRLGALLETAPASDCIALTWDGDRLVLRRPVYAGKALVDLAATKDPVLASLRPNVFAADSGKGATVQVETREPVAAPEHQAVLVETTEGAGGKLDLGEASTIVAGGRGLKDPDNFKALIEPLAEALGAAVGASRAVVDAGWRSHSEQVGQTGRVVAPKLYIACGISGAIQHLAGMRTSGTIVAINKDAEAPIFKVADYGIVGDVDEVLPALLESVKAMKG